MGKLIYSQGMLDYLKAGKEASKLVKKGYKRADDDDTPLKTGAMGFTNGERVKHVKFPSHNKMP